MKTTDELCGCGGPGKPLYELKLLVAALERQHEERKKWGKLMDDADRQMETENARRAQ